MELIRFRTKQQSELETSEVWKLLVEAGVTHQFLAVPAEGDETEGYFGMLRNANWVFRVFTNTVQAEFVIEKMGPVVLSQIAYGNDVRALVYRVSTDVMTRLVEQQAKVIGRLNILAPPEE